MASGAFVRVRRVAYVRYATSAMLSQTWTVSIMGRSTVHIVPVPSGFGGRRVMSICVLRDWCGFPTTTNMRCGLAARSLTLPVPPVG